MAFVLVINVKMPTNVGVLTFMTRKNFTLLGVEHEKVLQPGGLTGSAADVRMRHTDAFSYTL